jgi:hypothetical protein
MFCLNILPRTMYRSVQCLSLNYLWIMKWQGRRRSDCGLIWYSSSTFAFTDWGELRQSLFGEWKSQRWFEPGIPQIQASSLTKLFYLLRLWGWRINQLVSCRWRNEIHTCGIRRFIQASKKPSQQTSSWNKFGAPTVHKIHLSLQPP